MTGKRKLTVLMIGMALVAVVAAAGCGSTAASGNLSLSGSTTVQPIAQEAADQFMKKNPGANVTVQGGGSSVGVTNVSQGVSNIGNSSRNLADTEKNLGLVDHQVAYDIVVAIVNPDVTVKSLTGDQMKDVFLGKVTNWSQVGGTNAPITVVIRDESSGTRDMWDTTVLGKTATNPVKPVTGAIEANSNGVLRQKVASTPNSIGYISYGYMNKSVKALQFNGVTGNLNTALDKSYPLSRYLHMFTKGAATGLAKTYIDFVLSPDFQNQTVSKDYVPMTKISAQK